LAPDNPAVLDTLAFIEHLNGDNESAQQNIQRALVGAPDEMSIRYHAAVIDAALGETKNAIGMLEALIADGTADFPERTEAEKLLTKLRSE
jgi:Flp pilus assembly protein TadD